MARRFMYVITRPLDEGRWSPLLPHCSTYTEFGPSSSPDCADIRSDMEFKGEYVIDELFILTPSSPIVCEYCTRSDLTVAKWVEITDSKLDNHYVPIELWCAGEGNEDD